MGISQIIRPSQLSVPEGCDTNDIEPVSDIYSASKPSFAEQKDETPPSMFAYIRENTPKAEDSSSRILMWLENVVEEDLDTAKQHEVSTSSYGLVKCQV